MLLHNINNNILIYHPSYPDLYQDEAKKRELQKEINIYFWVGTKPKKTYNTVVHLTHAIINIKKQQPTKVLKEGWV